MRYVVEHKYVNGISDEMLEYFYELPTECLLFIIYIYSHREVFHHVLCTQASPPVLRRKTQLEFRQLFLVDL